MTTANVRIERILEDGPFSRTRSGALPGGTDVMRIMRAIRTR
jgi:hypothetical protein